MSRTRSVMVTAALGHQRLESFSGKWADCISSQGYFSPALRKLLRSWMFLQKPDERRGGLIDQGGADGGKGILIPGSLQPFLGGDIVTKEFAAANGAVLPLELRHEFAHNTVDPILVLRPILCILEAEYHERAGEGAAHLALAGHTSAKRCRQSQGKLAGNAKLASER